jgi:predicted Rossmann fold flavoprotein
LIAEARRRAVRFSFETTVARLNGDGGDWIIATDRGDLRASRVVLASGGLSVPSTGSDGVGLREAARLGHRVHDTYPALTPLVAAGGAHAALSGVSLPVRLRARWRGRTIEAIGGFLFTHRGYSGPAVLDVSHVAVRSRASAEHCVLRAQWSALSARDWEARLLGSPGLVLSLLSRAVPHRLATILLEESSIPLDRATSELRRAERTTLIDRLTAYELPWTGDEGYKKAEVTGGGVALDVIDPRTLESRQHPGLFFCGEMLDAFGPIGGHNFAWAWATGRLAGIGARKGAKVPRC